MKGLSGLSCVILVVLASEICADIPPMGGGYWSRPVRRPVSSATRDADSFQVVRRPVDKEQDSRRAAPSLSAMLPLLGVIVQAWVLYVGVGATAQREEPAPSGGDQQVNLDASGVSTKVVSKE